jgi:hypothetical protein
MNPNFEMIATIIELSLILVGLLLVVIGWILPYRQSLESVKQQQEFEKKLLCAKWEKELVDKQIAHFYAPIAELLREQDLRWRFIGEQIGRSIIFDDGKDGASDLPDDEQKIWIHFIDTYSIPINKKIIDIIQNHQHLIYKSEMPKECFKSFMEYAVGMELLDNQKKNGVPNYYDYRNRSNFPRTFVQYIEQTLTTLSKRQVEIMQVCL